MGNHIQALMCHELGDPARLRLETVRASPLGDADVRVAVKAAAVNFPDLLMIQGIYQEKPGLPFTPGLEIAGEVIECGRAVSDLKPGQRVMAFLHRGGGYATEVVVPAAMTLSIPNNMDFDTAAAFPIAYGTAYFALTHRGALRAGETLLVLGASGGVGLAAVEIGKLLGARVIAAARGEEKLQVAREHGADEVIDYEREDIRQRAKAITADRGVDVVFDPVGGSFLHQCVRAMAWEGRVLVVGFASGDIAKVATNLILVKNFSLIGVLFGADFQRHPERGQERFRELFRHFERGALRPRIFKRYPLAQASAALADMTARNVIGKMVLTV